MTRLQADKSAYLAKRPLTMKAAGRGIKRTRADTAALPKALPTLNPAIRD
jgi:hypothetical protein